MNILVLGGTAFLGRAFVEAATARGHQVTLFNRGQRDATLFTELPQIRGDREKDLDLLGDTHWDAVFDTSGYVPRIVSLSAQKLKDLAGRYLFISSISVFQRFDIPDQDETAPVAELSDPTVEAITGETYGGLKVLCERAVEEAFGDRALIVRPGLIVGPTDYSDRFNHWPFRMSKGGEVLAPDIKQQPVQIIDVRDLATFCLDLLEQNAAGVFNATGPRDPYTFEQVLSACAEGTDAKITWVGTDFLNEHKVQPWSDLPLALDFDGTSNGMCQVDVSRAVDYGLLQRPLADTVRDTLAWCKTRPDDHPWRAGLRPEREQELLALWHARE